MLANKCAFIFIGVLSLLCLHRHVPASYILVTDLFCSRGFMQIFMRILRLNIEVVCITVIWFLNIIISAYSSVILIMQSNEHKKTVRTCQPSPPAQTCENTGLIELIKKKKTLIHNRREAFLMQMIMVITWTTSAFTKMYILKIHRAKDPLSHFSASGRKLSHQY